MMSKASERVCSQRVVQTVMLPPTIVCNVAPIVAWLVQHDVEVEEVVKTRATLEDAFLDLMGLDAAGPALGRGDA